MTTPDNQRYPEMLLTLESKRIKREDNQSNQNMVMEAFTDILYNITEKIPEKAFKEIIDDILIEDFNDQFEFDFGHDSEDVFDNFETFSISVQPNGYQVDLELKVDYEVKRSELINDISFIIQDMTVFKEGDEMVLDYIQAEQIKQAVESKNYTA